jgi:hypothetical protein
MKKVLLTLTLFMFAVVAQVTAQTMEHISFAARMADGPNTLYVPDGRGTITLVKSGNTFSNVVYTDVAGAAYRFVPNGGTGAALPPDCPYPIPDACYSIPNYKNIGMCICGPKDLSAGVAIYNIGLLLPAVQKVRSTRG